MLRLQPWYPSYGGRPLATTLHVTLAQAWVRSDDELELRMAGGRTTDYLNVLLEPHLVDQDLFVSYTSRASSWIAELTGPTAALAHDLREHAAEVLILEYGVYSRYRRTPHVSWVP